jgi:hypothetical protein
MTIPLISDNILVTMEAIYAKMEVLVKKTAFLTLAIAQPDFKANFAVMSMLVQLITVVV